MTMLSVEMRLARLEAIVLSNGTKLSDSTEKVDYIAACDHPEVFEEWADGENYVAGDKRRHGGAVYVCLQPHTSQPDWTPSAAASLWAKVINASEDPAVIPAWEQPNSTNPYGKGDKVTHKGKTWESSIDNNVWEPSVYGWVEV